MLSGDWLIPPWVVLVGFFLAAVALYAIVWQLHEWALAVWEWWHRDRVSPLLEDPEDPEGTGVLCAGCAGFDHCDGVEGACDCTCGWSEDWAEEELPEERSAEDLGFTGLRSTGLGFTGFLAQQRQQEEHRERQAPWWEVEGRSAYAALDLDYPSGLLARVRELAP